MYIITKNKDYYDGVVGSVGMDKTLVYERTPVEVEKPEDIPKEFQGTYGWNRTRDNHFLNIGYMDIDSKKTKKYEKVHSFIVGFCGKLYLGWKLHYKVNGWDLETGEKKEFIETDIIYGYENVKKYFRESYWNFNPEDDVKYVLDYDPINIFREIKAPIFVHDTEAHVKYDKYHRIIGSNNFFINPILKEYEFYKVVDAFTAFTELQMFIGGVLGRGEKEIVEIEDKYKIPQHGFDKWSFRRMPNERNERKKRKKS
jgi:hypothetical protein